MVRAVVQDLFATHSNSDVTRRATVAFVHLHARTVHDYRPNCDRSLACCPVHQPFAYIKYTTGLESGATIDSD